MAYCKIYLTLSALITCHVYANYEYERLKSLMHLDRISQVPWKSQGDIYESASSEILPYYYNSYGASKDRYRDHFKSSSERFPISIKKESIEKKNLKKIPFYTFINKDSVKLNKDLIPDSGIAHCQEIKMKSTWKQDEPRKDVVTCYKCKNPKTKSTYEHCLYNSHPKESTSASTKLQRFSSVPTSFRYRRSNLGRDESDYGKPRNPYRFTDEYFVDATYDVPAAYESNGEKCDKIVKDSMVCMVCKDAKTNGKYEQCSYVKQPREKAYSYSKSSSFEKPQERSSDSDEHPESTSYSKSSDFEASNRQKDRNPVAIEESSKYSYPSEDYSEKTSAVNKRDEVQDAPSADCKQMHKDSKICTVCKDPKNGGTYEKCTYDYQPSDKLYKYSRSETFGYPDKISDSTRDLNKAQTSEKLKNFDDSQRSNSTYDYLERSELSTYPWRPDRIEAQQEVNNSDSTSRDSSNYNSDYSNPEFNNYESSSSNDNSKSYENQATPSSKSISEYSHSENVNADHCKKLQKDSMICMICKDPKTGNDFEQCSYSYQPSDKLFSYSKSRSFGNTRENDKSEEAPHKGEQSQDNFDIVKESHDEYIPGQNYEASTTNEAKSQDDTEEKKGVDVGYLDTARKKIEIEEFMQKFQKEDRSKCKKIMRDKMTCYQCVDEEGFQKEECAFVTGRKPNKDQLAFHEIKEFQVEPTSHALKLPSITKTSAVDPLEPSASASRNSYVRLRKRDNDYPDEAPHTSEEMKEAEPYDYTSETKSVYDKVLGMTLPAYMFTTSEHEAAFDEIVTSSHNKR